MKTMVGSNGEVLAGKVPGDPVGRQGSSPEREVSSVCCGVAIRSAARVCA
jgi:hypothetical protein